MTDADDQKADLRFGIIGCGNIAFWRHLQSLQLIRGVTVTALADPDKKALRRAVDANPADGFSDHRQLLDSGLVDAVVIATPNQWHAPQAIDSLQSGCHTYVEKPMAIDEPSAIELREVWKASALHLACGFNFRFHPVFCKGRQLVRQGCIGKLRSIHCNFSEPLDKESTPAWKVSRVTGGGALLDLASHHIDLCRWLLDDEVASCNAKLVSVLTEQDQASLGMEFQSGLTAHGFFSLRAGRTNCIEIEGESGYLRLDVHQGTVTHGYSRSSGYGVHEKTIRPDDLDRLFSLKKRVRPAFDPSFRRSMSAFVEQCQGHQAQSTDLANGLDGLRVIQTITAAEESALRGQWESAVG